MRRVATAGVLAVVMGVMGAPAAIALEVLPQQRSTAEQVAQQGVPLSALAENAPEAHTVKPGDTLWALSALFLKSPWRWPELWGMNLQQIRNPHLIFPGQVLVLVKDGERARLQIATREASAPAAVAAGAAAPPPEPPALKWNASVRSSAADDRAGAAIPLAALAPFLTQTAILSAADFESAARVVGGLEGRTLLWQGDLALVRGGSSAPAGAMHLYRDPQPLRDPQTGEVLGHEARFVGVAEPVTMPPREAGMVQGAGSDPVVYRIRSAVIEVLPGDLLLAPRERVRDAGAFVPRAPSRPVNGQVVTVQRDAMSAGQRQVVTLNRGARDGVERGHVLTLWKNAPPTPSARSALSTSPAVEPLGQLLIVGVTERVAHGLVMEVRDAVRPGDRVAAP